jgi:DNA-binding CsgD family transcriptional regulator
MLTTKMSVELVGRDAELGLLGTFLDSSTAGAAALVLEGEAGIGKSTLWSAGVAAARERDLCVLSARPAEAEQGLVYTGLGDLLEGELQRVLPELQPPRRRALDIALLLEESSQDVDPRAVAVAVRSALELLAVQAPVVLAIDDVQWLDPSSAAALAFALRRLRPEAVVLLLTRRLGEGLERSTLEEAVDTDRVKRLRVGPLSLGATHKLVRSRLGRTLGRPTLRRLHESSGGNPFFALELARALDQDVDPTQPLPVPDTVEGLLVKRFAGLPAATRDALLLVAAAGHPSRSLLRSSGVDDDAVEPALAANVVEPIDGTIRFTHPLLGSVLYQSHSAEERRRAHARLADVVVDRLGRARQLALATEGLDARVAAVLEDATAASRRRGAPIVAAELAEHALRLTPADAAEDHHRRAIAAARAHWDVGATQHAHALALDLVERSPPGPQRAEALILLSDTCPLTEAVRLRREALREPGLPAAERALIHQFLAVAVRLTEGMAAAEFHARTSLRLSDRLDDQPLRALALSALAVVHFRARKPDALDLSEQAHAIGATVGDAKLRRETGIWLASTLTHCFELERARALLQDLLEEWSDRDERVCADLLWHLSRVELRAGHLVQAADYIERAREINVQYWIDESDDTAIVTLAALVAAHRGRVDEAREAAEKGRSLAEEMPVYRGVCDGTLGLLELWSGDPESAVRYFAAAEEAFGATEMSEPALKTWRADYAEALLELGRVDEAVALLDDWERDASRLSREWVPALAARCRGLVAAANGDVQEALPLLEQAVARVDAVGDPIGRARALLALGIVRRRARQKRAAREAIEAAVSAFDEMGAVGWAEKARAELGRIGGRTREDGLTAAEQRVAVLAAAGRTNREVAAELFLGERTVESHLSRVYTKLGVRSRTELARRLAPRP